MSDVAKMKMEAGLKEVFKPSWYDLLKAQKYLQEKTIRLHRRGSGIIKRRSKQPQSIFLT